MPAQTPMDDLLKAHLERSTSHCPDCGYPVRALSRCSECGRELALALHASFQLSIPWVVLLAAWLFIVSDGLITWVSHIAMAATLGLNVYASALVARLNGLSLMVLLLALFHMVVLLLSPLVCGCLWMNRPRIDRWSPRRIFIWALIPILAYLIGLIFKLGLLA